MQGTVFAVPSWSARHFEDPWEFILENNIKGVNRLDVSNILDNIVVLWRSEVISPAGEASYMKILEQINFTLTVTLSASRLMNSLIQLVQEQTHLHHAQFALGQIRELDLLDSNRLAVAPVESLVYGSKSALPEAFT